MNASDATYTAQEFDAIALAGCESLVCHPGQVAPYDLEAYQRIEHQPVEDGQYPYFNQAGFTEAGGITFPEGCAADHGYLLRMGGFRRQAIFGPCEAADMIAAAGINYADGLGEGMFEHLLLCRRTGILPIFEAPVMGIPLPFLESELPIFERLYRRHVTEYCDWIRRAESVYGHELLGRAGHPWILYLRTTPLMQFQLSANRKPEETACELNARAGVHRFTATARTPQERAGQARAWVFIRRRHMEIIRIMARVFREQAAPRGILIGNTHALPVLDYEMLGEVFDHPGVAARAGYINAAAMREPYMGYSVRLFSDLSGRLPIMSVRINTLVSGTRFIPGPATIRCWFDEAVRHGVRGFYYWATDYPSQEGQYFGSLAGNTDTSTRGRERWDALLGCFHDVARTRSFIPPSSEIAILVAPDVLDIAGWRRVLGCFTELETARIWSRMIAARTVESDRSSLENLKVLVVPALPFASDALADTLAWFVGQGGTMILGNRDFARFDVNGDGRQPLAGLSETALAGNAEVDLPVGNGRVLVAAEPGIGLAIDAGDVDSALSAAVDRWHRYAENLQLGGPHWVYRVTTSGLHDLTGLAPSEDQPKPEPHVAPQAYMYEHSSPLIIPYINSPDAFSEDEGPNCR